MTARCGYVRAVDFEKGYGNGTRSHFSVCVRLRGNGFAGHLTAGDHEPDIANHRLICRAAGVRNFPTGLMADSALGQPISVSLCQVTLRLVDHLESDSEPDKTARKVRTFVARAQSVVYDYLHKLW